ncbi:hypothetical protein SDC9_165213 [bioreactor metagenome]|uniref:Uncharacterized protein n=1 Tax=bioreactor metagenome TaxID=1076179 RepID=A0A645FTS3_9ZZZZ
MAHRFEWLIYGEARRVRSDFEKDAAFFPEVKGFEIIAVTDRCGVLSQGGDMLQPIQMIRFIFCPPCDMMDGSDTHDAGANGGHFDIDCIAESSFGTETDQVIFLGDTLQAHNFFDDSRSVLGRSRQQDGSRKAFDGMFRGNAVEGIRVDFSVFTFHQFQMQTMRIIEVQISFPETGRFIERNVVIGQAFFPE